MADWDRLLGGNVPAGKSMENDSVFIRALEVFRNTICMTYGINPAEMEDFNWLLSRNIPGGNIKETQEQDIKHFPEGLFVIHGDFAKSDGEDDFSDIQRVIEDKGSMAFIDPAGGKIVWEDIVSTDDPFNPDSTFLKDEFQTIGGGAINWVHPAELPPNVNPLEQKISALEGAVEQLVETVTGLQALVRILINEPQKG